MNLQAVGFDESSIQEFLICWSAGEREKQLRLLSQKREGLLAQVHREEKQIHCLDYLVYRIQRRSAAPHTSSRNGGTTP